MNTVINFCTQALGDSIAFSPYADEYQRIYGGHVYVKTKWYTILKSNNSNVYFVEPNMEIKYDKYFEIHFHFTNIPMQKLACDQLGIEYKEILPNIKESSKHKFNKKAPRSQDRGGFATRSCAGGTGDEAYKRPTLAAKETY